MFNAKQFAKGLGLIRTYSEQVQETLAGMYAYALYQHHSGNDNPKKEFKDALESAKGFMSEIAPKLTYGKRDKTMQPIDCERKADAVIGFLFIGRKERLAEAKAAKAERAAAKAAMAQQNEEVGGEAPDLGAQPSVPMLKSALIDGAGEMMELTGEELAAALAAVMAVRNAPLRIAA